MTWNCIFSSFGRGLLPQSLQSLSRLSPKPSQSWNYNSVAGINLCSMKKQLLLLYYNMFSLYHCKRTILLRVNSSLCIYQLMWSHNRWYFDESWNVPAPVLQWADFLHRLTELCMSLPPLMAVVAAVSVVVWLEERRAHPQPGQRGTAHLSLTHPHINSMCHMAVWPFYCPT